MASKKLYLLYVNELGPDYKGNYMYEFIFGPETDIDVDDLDWDSDGKGQPPIEKDIDKVGVLKDSFKLDVIQNSDFFCLEDAQDNVIALAWESYDDMEEEEIIHKRLVFHYGEVMEKVTDKLYERDITLDFNN